MTISQVINSYELLLLLAVYAVQVKIQFKLSDF